MNKLWVFRYTNGQYARYDTSGAKPIIRIVGLHRATICDTAHPTWLGIMLNPVLLDEAKNEAEIQNVMES